MLEVGVDGVEGFGRAELTGVEEEEAAVEGGGEEVSGKVCLAEASGAVDEECLREWIISAQLPSNPIQQVAEVLSVGIGSGRGVGSIVGYSVGISIATNVDISISNATDVDFTHWPSFNLLERKVINHIKSRTCTCTFPTFCH